MKAKEMFEKLGYTDRIEKFKDDKLFAITFANYEKEKWVTIEKERIITLANGTIISLDASKIPAINQALKELGVIR